MNLNNTQDSLRYQKLLAMFKYQQILNTSQQSTSAIYSSFQENILSCKFQETPCNFSSDFSYFFFSDYSYCFKYNSDLTNLKATTMPGSLNGFQFSMYLGDSSGQFVNKRGLRVFIDNSTHTYPIKYIDIQPGVLTNIALKQRVFQHLPMPYTNCIADLTANTQPQTDVMQYMFRNLSVTTYSYSLCQAIVFSYNLLQTCKCLDSCFLKTEVNLLCHTSSQLDCLNSFRTYFDIDVSPLCPFGNLRNFFFSGLK